MQKHEDTRGISAQLVTHYTINAEREKKKVKELRTMVEIIQIPNQQPIISLMN